MLRFKIRFVAIAGTVIAYFVTVSAMATDYKVGSLEIIGPWSRATPKGASTAIGYMTIKNNGTTPDRLIGGSVDFASSFQSHSMTMENGISKMRELKSVDIGPGQTIEFKPGGFHVMFVGVKHPLSEGEHVKGTLIFEHAGTVQIDYDVQGIGAQSRPHDMGSYVAPNSETIGDAPDDASAEACARDDLDPWVSRLPLSLSPTNMISFLVRRGASPIASLPHGDGSSGHITQHPREVPCRTPKLCWRRSQALPAERIVRDRRFCRVHRCPGTRAIADPRRCGDEQTRVRRNLGQSGRQTSTTRCECHPHPTLPREGG